MMLYLISLNKNNITLIPLKQYKNLLWKQILKRCRSEKFPEH